MPHSPIPLRQTFPIGKDTISHRLAVLGREIMCDLEKDADPDGSIHLTVVPILSGAFMFAADLIRSFKDANDEPHPGLNCRVEFVRASSRPNDQTKNVVEVDTTRLNRAAVQGCHCLVVDDILDSGQTLRSTLKDIAAMNPKSLRTAVLLDKYQRHDAQFTATYTAFRIIDAWVIGYGLDQNGLFRNLQNVDVLDTDTRRPQSWQRRAGK